ncbi:malto-oligosyltrehalose synthase [Kitasatospora kifunensis]|uniref:(1->4)-alpha-D-glucan 1-alpha-D-glucosylmutase n=1 Tax=Kitasatospora kifunensis TaxID=58351 RepID=A0A7W7R062_KITKI|nr:malto-oligosyltrehalose synthase [Kitasatospora kifunensis]MBB4922744.1 (1->4)-alpha-D-glucan 1-alpha-D-glucosylmutase [Kitasatospora kifunensis]
MTSPPTASYRLQLQPSFTLADAAEALPYLAGLGISHLHLSPLLEAAPGSTHGYDTVDHTRISEQLGGEAGLRALATAAHRHGLRLIADVVPNHMALPVPERLNAPLWQVLRDGPESPFAHWFDIDWAAQGGRILLPVLGERLGAVLDQLTVDQDTLRYHDHVFPLRPGTERLPLTTLLSRQHYRLAWWRLAGTELNYRRFFNISELIALRVEDPRVFQATHGLLLRLREEGVLDGFRVDHPDGLADPRAYLSRLAESSGHAYTVVEKILTGQERLPEDWPCAGTTGYDALRHIDGVLTDGAGARRLTELYTEYTGLASSAAEQARIGRAGLTGPSGELAAELNRLVRLAERIGAEEPALADHAPLTVRAALRDLLTHYPVYRPYRSPVDQADQADQAVSAPTSTEEFVELLTQGRLGSGPLKEEFRDRFAQSAAAVAAKGVEDTAFYRWYPLLSLNEVGGDPAHPGVEPADFHRWCESIQRHWPLTMTALSTHDTKRSADARARLAVLAELPERWAAECRHWSALAVGLWDASADRNVEWLLWQTLVAAWPISVERLQQVLLKSIREAKLATSWTAQDAAYESAVARYAAAVLTTPELTARIGAFVESLEPYARSNSLSAALLHLTMPGVPDLYQGSERPLYTLVDPDNRAPVDFTTAEDELGDFARHKLHLTRTALRLPRPLGHYRPLPAGDHLIAYQRGPDLTVLATRLPYTRARRGEPAVLELPGRWRDLLTDRRYDGTVDTIALLAREAS